MVLGVPYSENSKVFKDATFQVYRLVCSGRLPGPERKANDHHFWSPGI
jgi:hypothetical protein